MRKIASTLERTTAVLGNIVLAFMVVTICYDAIMRYVFTAPTSWSLEVNTFLIVYVAVMTAAEVQRTDSHIRITFFADKLGATGQRINRAVISFCGLVFCAIIAWRGWLIAYQSWEFGERVSSSFGTPMVVPYAMLPIGFGLLALRFAFDLFDSLTGRPSDRGEDLQNV
ncbi:TRAP transporter small permease [Ruegeria sediminis]|uniref:TRAP transporter small permease protein n=1 Tax=Ruegeria sediminis TaxID=2583820 RepID=A0ABY2WTZ7_9RHOB|nr:TRAP transporter small permease [Ruegeria sediminis]TMV04236.1 TRAP transporter small permease [Ruegeria sediminis]